MEKEKKTESKNVVRDKRKKIKANNLNHIKFLFDNNFIIFQVLTTLCLHLAEF